jgi:hypothetical protein
VFPLTQQYRIFARNDCFRVSEAWPYCPMVWQ